jgi:hypothetical protein
MSDKHAGPHKNDITVYIIVHELFAIYMAQHHISLLPPVVPPCVTKEQSHDHKYRIARFKEGKWIDEQDMVQHDTYTIDGLVGRKQAATSLPCHDGSSPFPHGQFQRSNVQPFCTWTLPIPKFIHQLRIVRIPDDSRPLFTGDPHGDAINAQLTGISVVQAFEYLKDPAKDLAIANGSGPLKIDCSPDSATKKVNIHLWAQLEDESGMDDQMANEHATKATRAVVDLFTGIEIEPGEHSLSLDDQSVTQVSMPQGIRFPELMTLSERFQLKGIRTLETIECSARTCGHGGTLYVAAK